MSVRARESARTTLEWKCYGLTTADRPARQAHVRAELERTTLPFDVLVSERPPDAGGFASVGFRGCFESHLRALRTARDQGADVAVLVEDDAVVVSRFLEMLPEIQRELDSIEWSVLLLGYLGDQSPARHFRLEQISPHLARADHWEFTGSHFIAVNGAAFDALIDDFARRQLPGGHRISVDGVFNEFRHASGHPTLVCVPNLSRQGPSPSGISAQAGLRARLLRHGVVQRLLLTFKRSLWDLEAMLPASWSVRCWNARARLTARSRHPNTTETTA
jgi:glycosyl transferase family 25